MVRKHGKWIVGILLALSGATPAWSGDLYKPFRAVIVRPVEAIAHRDKPKTGQDNSIETLARQIDWLEHHIDAYGTVVAKQPDIWGEARLTKYRQEYEAILFSKQGNFDETLQAALRRSDQAFLANAIAIQAATGANKTVPGAADSTTILGVVQQSISDPTTKAGAEGIITRSDFNLPVHDATKLGFAAQPLSLEPTVFLDQLSRYQNHLNELRRINEGDDTADSPGYSLNLVRIPISVLPGKKTRQGYGAEITITVDPYHNEELLPIVFRRLVINDLIDQYAPPITHFLNLNSDDVLDIVKQYESIFRPELVAEEVPVPAPSPATKLQFQTLDGTTLRTPNRHVSLVNHAVPSVESIKQFQSDIHRKVGGTISMSYLPGGKSRRAVQPYPASQIGDVIGYEFAVGVCASLFRSFENDIVNRKVVHTTDVQGILAEELESAYEFLNRTYTIPKAKYEKSSVSTASRLNRNIQPATFQQPPLPAEAALPLPPRPATESANESPHSETKTEVVNAKSEVLFTFWDRFCNQALAGAIRGRDAKRIKEIRDSYCEHVVAVGAERNSLTTALAWATIVQAALLDERLNQDVREASRTKGCHCSPEVQCRFVGPDPDPVARGIFAEYCRCRWPVHVFALDPVTQDQNIADAFMRRREQQLAVSLAFASGKIGAQTMTRYIRRLEWDMATIALNRTAVGFSHGNDTFGWRFFPRFQTPPVKGQLATIGESIFGGPTTDADMNQRQLEAGQRECVAIVIMPSFVPYAVFDTRSNWFKLTNPKVTEISMRDTMELSRSIKSMQMLAFEAGRCAHLYRDGESQRLLRRVHQLDRELPLQTMVTSVPYENTLGGFEMFNTGITALAPELTGWYGAPGIHPEKVTTMFISGENFSVNRTQFLAGGQPLNFRLLSRQIAEVELPPGMNIIKEEKGAIENGDGNHFEGFVDVHVATPYGVSNHLLVPVLPTKRTTSNHQSELFSWSPGNFSMGYTAKWTDPAWVVTTTQLSLPTQALVIRSFDPRLAPAKASLRLGLFHNGNLVGAIPEQEVPLDPRTGEYYLMDTRLKAVVEGVNSVAKEYIQHLMNVDSANYREPIKLILMGRVTAGNLVTDIDGGVVFEFSRLEPSRLPPPTP